MPCRTTLLALTLAAVAVPVAASASPPVAAPTPPPVAAPAPPPVAATAPVPRFKWTAGEVHTYRIEQQTTVKETTPDEKTERPVTTETRTDLTLTRAWTVKDVDANGVGTLEMTIRTVRNEFRRPDGTSLVLDSSDPEKAREMAGFLNVPVLTVRVDTRGRLVEVKEARAGGAARLQAELPFRLTLPDGRAEVWEVGTKWDRPFSVKLDPPQGTGETYEFTQTYTTRAVRDGLLVVAVETSLKNPPKTLSERVPLVPLLWGGEVYFDTTGGKYRAARLSVRAELPDYLGEGTKFEYQSVYTEDAVEK
jgi:hypothetical protein